MCYIDPQVKRPAVSHALRITLGAKIPQGLRITGRAPRTSGSVLRASSIWIGLIGYACL